jgi:hypothetical protein
MVGCCWRVVAGVVAVAGCEDEESMTRGEWTANCRKVRAPVRFDEEAGTRTFRRTATAYEDCVLDDDEQQTARAGFCEDLPGGDG